VSAVAVDISKPGKNVLDTTLKQFRRNAPWRPRVYNKNHAAEEQPTHVKYKTGSDQCRKEFEKL